MKRRVIDDADRAIAELTSGNARFRQVIAHVRGNFRGDGGEDLVLPLDPMTLGVAMVEGAQVAQEPFGLVLGCSDARVPHETIFSQDCNGLFVVRVAGNVLGIECLGSIDFAVGNMKSIKVLLVLGHLGCGAVTAAVDMYLSPNDYLDLKLTHSLRTILDRIIFAVRGAANALEREGGSRVASDPNYRRMLIELAIYLNAVLNAFDLVRRLARDDRNGVRVIFGVFDIAGLRVRSHPEGQDGASDTSPGFAEPPVEANDFDHLAGEMARTLVARRPMTGNA